MERGGKGGDPAYDPRQSLSCLDAVNAIFFCMGASTRTTRARRGSVKPPPRARARNAAPPARATLPRSHASPPRQIRAGPGHQFDRYYKDGAFDSCRARFSELAFCVKLKAASGDQAATMLRQLLRDERTTEGVVWQTRSGPPPPLEGAAAAGARSTTASGQ